ncbi:MAG TPA: ubiquinone biosynthesis regulatory protein kinase UbiB [Gammaproteobacteria bacterium]
MIHINFVLAKHGLDEVIFATHLFRPVRFLVYLAPWTWFRRHDVPRGVRIRRVLEDLGPIFIKFGQMLSTRRDLVPHDIADELAKLQDRVPPFEGSDAVAIVERALRKPLAEVFATFDETPLASASIAQVHAATLLNGQRVVVKVLRPNIYRIIRRDIELMNLVAELAHRYWREGRRLRPVEVVAEYEKTILDELDLMREGANATELKRNFRGSDQLYVPEVYWEWTRRDVMVMERIQGVPVGDIAALEAAGTDMKVLSERGVEIFFTQVFRHNFFHADMHPGNIFVDITDPKQPRYIAVDFGIVGTLEPRDQRYLAENFVAFFNRDYQRVAELHVESGWVPKGTRVDEFEFAIRTVCEPIFNKPLKDISFGQLLVRLFQTARRFNMEVQPQLVLLQKTLLNIEGLGRQLDPDLDLWVTAKPYLERWMQEQVGWPGFVRAVRAEAPTWAATLPQIPRLVHRALLEDRLGPLRASLERLAEENARRNRLLSVLIAVLAAAVALFALELFSL